MVYTNWTKLGPMVGSHESSDEFVNQSCRSKGTEVRPIKVIHIEIHVQTQVHYIVRLHFFDLSSIFDFVISRRLEGPEPWTSFARAS